jgi:hypothetical protein
MAKNPGNYTKTKHIDIRNHFIREKIADGMFGIEYCATESMIADIFTKALPRPAFERLRDYLQIVCLDSGGVLRCIQYKPDNVMAHGTPPDNVMAHGMAHGTPGLVEAA